MSLPTQLESMLSKVERDLAKQKDNILMAQFNELIVRGLLVVEETTPTLVQSMDRDTVELRQAVRLVLKDQEYIEQLENEIMELRKNLDYVKEFAERLSGVSSNVRGSRK
jgi:hypothetical protein